MKEPLGNLLAGISTGTTPPSREARFYDGEIPWFTPGDLGDSKSVTHSARTLSRTALEARKAKLFQKGTLLFVGIGATVGKVGVAGIPCSANQQIIGLTFKPSISVDFA